MNATGDGNNATMFYVISVETQPLACLMPLTKMTLYLECFQANC